MIYWWVTAHKSPLMVGQNGKAYYLASSWHCKLSINKKIGFYWQMGYFTSLLELITAGVLSSFQNSLSVLYFY
jgi:hypothetical protein